MPAAKKKDDEESEWVLKVGSGSMGNFLQQTKAPFVRFLAGDRPPFLLTANLVLAHLRQNSDYINGRHIIGFPMVHWSGYSDSGGTGAKKAKAVGYRRWNYSKDSQSKMAISSPSGVR